MKEVHATQETLQLDFDRGPWHSSDRVDLGGEWDDAGVKLREQALEDEA